MNDDLISRAAAIDAMEDVDWYHINKDGQLIRGANSKEDESLYKAEDVYKVLNDMPSAQPERLTDDDFETIRIHLSAYKERLCNQRRWEEAEEYQRIIDRFMSFASAQQEIIHCGECKHRDPEDHKCDCGHDILWQLPRDDRWYCADAERRTDG